jgi:VanZ family protein
MKRKIIYWLPIIIWMIVIFMFSSQNGNQSEHNNRFVIDLLKHLGINLDTALKNNSNFIVRKCAHMTEYFILYILVFRALSQEISYSKALICSLVIVSAYASTDEFHQSFIPGRGPSVRDVMIDTCGGIIALLVTMFLKRKNQKV